jgi:hypothetical protein
MYEDQTVRVSHPQPARIHISLRTPVETPGRFGSGHGTDASIERSPFFHRPHAPCWDSDDRGESNVVAAINVHV